MDTDTTITDDIINEAINNGENNKEIAEKFGVAPSTIWKWRKARQGTPEREFAVAALRAEGLGTKAISEAIGVKEGSVWNIEQRMREKGNNPLLLPKRIKSAVKFVDKLRAGEPFGTIEKVKDSTALAANAMILDRAFPKQSDTQVGPFMSFTTINLGIVSTPVPEVIDVTPGTISCGKAHNSE